MHKESLGILCPNPKDTLWRYLSLEKFASLLYTQSLYFVRADQFEDPFEGSVPPLIDELYKQLYCLRFFRPLPNIRLCYNTISLKGVSNGETKNLHP